MSYTFTHEALYHGGGEDLSIKRFSHPGHEHEHDAYFKAGPNERSEETDHDSDHHDDDTHDHHAKSQLIKSDPSTHQKILSSQVVVDYLISDNISLSLRPSIYQVIKDPTAFTLPIYLRAHILLL